MLSPSAKKARLIRTYLSRFPLWCAWQVTYRCNFRCSFCGYWKDPLGKAEDQPVSAYAQGAKKLAGMGSMLVSLAGGEPFLRRDLPEIIREIAEFHLPFVTTNGSCVTPDVAEAVMDAGLWGVSVSIDYASPDRHDKARGHKGAWEKAWRAVELFSRARKHDFQRVNVMAVLLDDNLDELPELMKMAAKHHAYFMVQPYGHLKTGSHDFKYTNGEVSPRLLQYWRENPNFLSNPDYLSKFDVFLNGGVPHCKAGRAFFNIDSLGNIAICVENKHHSIANLFKDSRYAIVRRLKKASEHNLCTACWYNCRGEVESLYRPMSLLHSLPTFIFNRGKAEGHMGRW